MKKIEIFIAVLVAGIGICCLNANAQTDSDPERKDIKGVVLEKTIRPAAGDDKTKYTIRLDSYVTGASQSTTKEVAKPLDIVLVLDVSGSMDKSITTSYSQYNQTSYSYKNYPGSLYYLYNGNYYKVIKGTSGSSNNRYDLHFEVGTKTFYLKDKSCTETINDARKRNNTDVIFTGVLYEINKTEKKIDLLNNAVKTFINTVYERTKGPDGSWGTEDDVNHRIGIVTFSPKLGNKKHCDYDQQSVGTWYGAKTITNLLDVKTKKTELDGYIKFTAEGGTLSSGGLHHADEIFKGHESDYTGDNARTKVVVMFTDGVPGMSGWSKDEANKAINVAKTLKSSYTKDGKTIKGASIYTIGIFDNLGSDEENVTTYMNYVSTNYPDANSMTDPGQNPIVGGKYYQRSDGSDLSVIFQTIAEQETSGSATVTVDEKSASLVDIVSNNFKIPEGTTKDDIRIWVESCINDPANGSSAWAKPGEEYYHYKGITPSGDNITITGNRLEIKGFNYSKDDTKDGKTVTDYDGNWVGPRIINNITYYYGNKLVVEFDVKLNESYAGGLEMPSNDLGSGLYIDTDGDGYYDEYKPYPVPNVDFPSICIMKDGLQYGESAIFTLKGKGVFNVMLSQKKSNGMLEPCYKVIKTLDSNQSYTVTEDSWSWMYLSTDPEPDASNIVKLTYALYNIPESVYIENYPDAKEYIRKTGDDLSNCGVIVGKQKKITVNGQETTYCVLKDTMGEYENSAVSLLFHFTNEYNTKDKPARSEAFKSNEFRGGTAGGGTVGGGTDEGSL